MSTTTRTAGVAGTFTYTLSVVPFAPPSMTIYSDAARTVVAVAAAVLVATANPTVFTASYPAALVAGTYHLSFITVVTSGQPALVDADDQLMLVAVTGGVAGGIAADVAAIIPQRTGDDVGEISGSWSATTVPTATQVDGVITGMAAEVLAETGPIPTEREALYRRVVALGAAAQVDQSFYPDLATDALWQRYEAALRRLKGASTGDAGDVVADPVFGFPTLDGRMTTWDTRL